MRKIGLLVKVYYKIVYCAVMCCVLLSQAALGMPVTGLRESKNDFTFRSAIISFVDGMPYLDLRPSDCRLL